MEIIPTQQVSAVSSVSPIVEKEDGNLALTALVPTDMQGCQTALIAWCKNKLARMEEEAKELSDAYEHAKARKWKSEPIRKHAKMAARRVVFYDKMLHALQNGFVIIPNFPVSMFATRKEEGAKLTGCYRVRAGQMIPDFVQGPDELPAGEGEYKNPQPIVTQSQPFKVTGDNIYEYVHAYPASWDEMEFPITMAKPEIMQATDRAMALKVFDEIGILPAETKAQARAKGDPIIVGRLHDPRGRVVTFMLAWHLDTRQL